MTDDQINRIVQHLCQQLHLTIRLKGSEAHPPNAKDIGFDSASVNTVLRTGLKLAGVTVVDQSLTYTGEEPPWSRASRWSGRPGSTSCSLYNAK
jgi:hypothetical protein